jgi:formamidopyrimidine-DNA glycosylase
MPELPEVQTIVDDLRAQHLIGCRISGFKVFWRRTVNGISDEQLKDYLIGKTICQIKRRGKYIVFILDDNSSALLHLRMSGRLRVCRRDDKYEKHERLALAFANGFELRLHDTRKFARFYVGRDTLGRLEGLGPEPLDPHFKPETLHVILAGKDRMLKALLLDQTVIAGLGNIYVDESLWKAGIHPRRRSGSLIQQQTSQLYKAIRLVLRRGIRNYGTSLGKGLNNYISVSRGRGANYSYLEAYGRQGQSCRRCDTKIKRIKVNQRSTYYCPLCQK